MPTLLDRLKEAEEPGKDNKRIIRFHQQGYTIEIGLNALSNDSMVQTHVATPDHSECLWMHADGARGSHVILCVSGKPAPADEIIKFAAGKALKFSKSECSSVRYAHVSDLFKPDKAGPGVWKTRRYLQIDL